MAVLTTSILVRSHYFLSHFSRDTMRGVRAVACVLAFALLACAVVSAPVPIAYSVTSNPAQQFTANVGGVNVGASRERTR